MTTTPKWPEVMREARVPMPRGCILLEVGDTMGGQVLGLLPDGSQGPRVEVITSMGNREQWYCADAYHDLTDWPTRMLVLKWLAERVGLDPSGGVLWGLFWESRARAWCLECADNRYHLFHIDAEGDLLALALACREVSKTPPTPTESE